MPIIPELKICTHCGKAKPTSEFWKSNNQIGGLQSYCKECSSEAYSRWKIEHQSKKEVEMPRFTGSDPARRGKELKPIREAAIKIWEKDDTISHREIMEELIKLGFPQMKEETVSGWRKRWNRGTGIAKSTHPIQNSASTQAALKPGANVVPSWDDVIKAVPDRSELASLVLDGFIKVIGDRNEGNDKLYEQLNAANETIGNLSEELKNITEDRKRLMQDYNNYITKQKTGGHFSLDQTRHILFPMRPD